VLIHGLWMTPLAWERWGARYEERGFTVLTPGYPGIAGGTAGVTALREDPSPLANLGVREEQSQAAYDRYAVPVPGRILFQGGFANVTPHAATIYNFADDDRAPLLFISGASDDILPPAMQRENYEKNVKHSTAITAYKLFPGRDHYTCGEEGWEVIADLALDWALDPQPGELD